ncbi:hypothetical protein VPHK469_0131 [Vibrio phage K469]
MINLKIVEGRPRKTIEPEVLTNSMWYPIHQGDAKGDLIGFVQFIGGKIFTSIINNANPIVSHLEGIRNALANLDAVIVDEPSALDMTFNAEPITVTFRDIKEGAMFESNETKYMRLNLGHAMSEEGRVCCFDVDTEVEPLHQIAGAEAIDIEYRV